MKSPIDVGKRLEKARKEKGLTQAELSNETGIPRSSIANYETGKYGIPSDIAEKLCKFLGIKESFLLFGEVGEPNTQESTSINFTDDIIFSFKPNEAKKLFLDYNERLKEKDEEVKYTYAEVKKVFAKNMALNDELRKVYLQDREDKQRIIDLLTEVNELKELLRNSK
jgi:transcriptional regulator with XRE-family HTH domain